MEAAASHAAPAAPAVIPVSLWRRRAGLAPTRPHPATINTGQPVQMAPGVWLLRLPLPFALNHINVYLLDDGEGWTIVDCGLDTPASRQVWTELAASDTLCGRPLTRIVVTHHHPDHIGLAGWLAQRFNIPVSMTPGELAVAGRYADPQRDVVAERTPLWHEHGLPPELATQLLERMPRYAVQVHALPANVGLIDPTQPLLLGGRRWRPLIGRGHSPQHLSLLDETGRLMIGGDQVLPKITPNIAVWPGGDANPLLSYLESLRAFESLEDDVLLLPSHKQPMNGIATRVEELRAHHEQRLHDVLAACTAPMSCYDMLPVLFGRPLHNEEVGFGLGEAIAHLHFLQHLGWLVSSLGPDGRRRFQRSATAPHTGP